MHVAERMYCDGRDVKVEVKFDASKPALTLFHCISAHGLNRHGNHTRQSNDAGLLGAKQRKDGQQGLLHMWSLNVCRISLNLLNKPFLLHPELQQLRPNMLLQEAAAAQRIGRGGGNRCVMYRLAVVTLNRKLRGAFEV
jgi:hypothetical protein